MSQALIDAYHVVRKNRTLLLPMGLILLVGISLAMWGANFTGRLESRNLQQEFLLATENYAAAVQREVESNLAAAETLAGFIESSTDLDSSEFRSYSQKAIVAYPSILSLEWAPAVLHANRPCFEKALSAQEHRPVEIHSNLGGKFVLAQPADLYYPIQHMFPEEHAKQILGYDLNHSRLMRPILARAGNSRRPAAGGKIPLVEKADGGFGIVIYVPVYGRLAREGANPKGYAISVFLMGNVLENGLKRLRPLPIDFDFYDLQAPHGQSFLYSYSAGSSSHQPRFFSLDNALRPRDFKRIMRLIVADREWAMVSTATDSYLNARHSWKPLAVLLAGIGGTMVLAGWFFVNIAWARREEELEALRARQSVEEALRESEERYSLAALGSKDGLWDWDLDTGEVYYSDRWKSMIGYDPDEIGSSAAEWLDRIHPAEKARVSQEISGHCDGATPHIQTEYRLRHRDGTYRWMLTRGVAVMGSRGRATRIAGSQTDVTEGKSADALTGLASRILLTERLEQAIDRMAHNPAALFAVLFLDLDHFKLVNDSLGHVAGDKLLVNIAGRLRVSLRANPAGAGEITIARLGGDEFAVLIEGLSTQAEAESVAAAIQSSISAPFDLDGQQVFVSFSVGLRIGAAGVSAEDILRDADLAMYDAKSRGKARCELFHIGMRSRAAERLRLETDLRNAIFNGEIDVHYQPKVGLQLREIIDVEALARWNHPTRGLILPSEFIPVADETGLIIPLGRAVLRKACAQMASWQRDYPAKRVALSVNLSCRQFKQSDLVEDILRTLSETGLSPQRLSLEITESCLMENKTKALEMLQQLRARGIGLQIDDFGTGYSSFSYLHQLPFTELKIDRSFVSGMSESAGSAQIVRTIIVLARTLGMNVVAEGIETRDQLSQLTALGCDYGQGYLFAKPAGPEAIERLLETTVSPFFLKGLEETPGVQLIKRLC